MSQAGVISISGGGGGGSPIETLTGNSGGPVPPTANNIFVLGGESSVNNTNGITVIGNPGTSTETVTLTNRITGSTTTSDGAGQTQVFSTFALGATPGTYLFDTNIAAFNKTASLGASYKVSVTRRTTGAADFGIEPDTFIQKEEGAMIGVSVTVLTSGNNFSISVTGLSGNVIDWVALTTYVFAS